MKKPRTVRVSAVVPAATRDALKKKADGKGMKFSAFIVMMLELAAKAESQAS